MDRPVLHPLVRELAESERFRAFLEELPDTRARVSEPALPLLIAALYEGTGSAAWVSAALFVGVVGSVIGAPAAGYVGDHYDRRRVLISTALRGAGETARHPHARGRRRARRR